MERELLAEQILKEILGRTYLSSVQIISNYLKYYAEEATAAVVKGSGSGDSADTVPMASAQLPAVEPMAVKPLEWTNNKSLIGWKLCARDPFGNEFARIDLKDGVTGDEIECYKTTKQADYENLIRSPLATPSTDLREENANALALLAEALTRSTDAEAHASTLSAENERLKQHIEELQDKASGNCACSYDEPGDVCMSHSPTVKALKERLERVETVGGKIMHWAQARCPCENEQPNPCPLCGASVENLEACKAVESVFPRDILRDLQTALAREGKPKPTEPVNNPIDKAE